MSSRVCVQEDMCVWFYSVYVHIQIYLEIQVILEHTRDGERQREALARAMQEQVRLCGCHIRQDVACWHAFVCLSTPTYDANRRPPCVSGTG